MKVLSWLYHLSFPSAMNKSCYCYTYSPAFGVVSVWDFSHSNRFIWYLIPNHIRHWIFFHMLIVIYISSLVSYLGLYSFLTFYFLLSSFKICLHILNTCSFSDMCFAKIFSQSVASLFILLTSVFCRTEGLKF